MTLRPGQHVKILVLFIEPLLFCTVIEISDYEINLISNNIKDLSPQIVMLYKDHQALQGLNKIITYILMMKNVN